MPEPGDRGNSPDVLAVVPSDIGAAASATATTMRSPRPSTAFTRRSSSIDMDHGGLSKPSSSPRRMGGLVQPSQAAGTQRQHPSSRS